MTSLIRLAAFLLAIIALGCAKSAPPAPGQLMVTLVTDLAPPKDFDEVRVLVTYKGEAKHDTTYALRGSTAIKLPATFAVIAGSEPATPVDVHVEARLRGKVVVVRDARTTVPGDRIANLTIPIEFLCVGQVSGAGASLCAAEQTCMGGSCGPSTVDASTLPTFDPTGVFGGAKEPGASGRCFDVLDCFGEAEPVTADAACSLAIPADRGSGLNVALLNAERTQGICASNACLVVLDNDGARGWVEANGRIQLPAAACTPARNGSRALVATRCATKKPSDPPCGSWSSSGSVATDGTLVEINLGDAGAPNSGDGGVGDSGTVPQDICSQNNGGCSAYATCAVGDGGAPVCTCRPGYTGDGLGCIDVNECLVDRGGCAVDATCTNTPGSRTCVCNAGYAGNGLSCADVDECATQNGGCSADATCTNRLGFRTCTCTSGFSGDGLTCADVNECATANGGCDANATCTNTIGSRNCACNTGYEGSGVTCTDVNECATANGGCAAFAQCTNLAGGRSCACQPGFLGDGVTCANVDECLANAVLCGTASAGTCTDTPGAYACTCKPGYTLENGTCVDINECATQNGGCSANATCTNAAGSRSCACNAGWSGDGVTCTCIAESDASLCSRAAQNCGALTATDNCGAVRSLASCGTCLNGETCFVGGRCAVPPADLTATTAAMSGGGLADCGLSGDDNCARSPLVVGGTFFLGDGTSTPTTISDFRLDKYEVTVGRFRKFLDAWLAGWRPTAGSGKHTHLNNGNGLASSAGGFEPGWDAAWASYVGAPNAGAQDVPYSPAAGNLGAWTTILKCNATYQTWTSTTGANEKKPQNCLNWYDVHAFCIWDGSFLPTNAEWEYAAAGGSEERTYPWGATEPDDTLAVFQYSPVENVGGRPLGNGKWGQSDLGGNVYETNLDGRRRGGSHFLPPSYLMTSYDPGGAKAERNGIYMGETGASGGRCARRP